MQSVNDAPAGDLIAGSEKAVRDAVAKLCASMFERALQLRVDAIEQQLPAPIDPLTSKKTQQGITLKTQRGCAMVMAWESNRKGDDEKIEWRKDEARKGWTA